MTENKIIVVSGPSGSGKSTIARYLLNSFPAFEFSVSSTTRMQRPNEVDGKDYYFIPKDKFFQEVKNNNFIEYEEVYEDIFYGTGKNEINRIFANKKTPLLDIDVKGALSIKKIYADQAFLIFIHPGSVSVLKKRLLKRNTDQPDVIEKRLSKAEYEMSFSTMFDAIVKNDTDIESCFSKVRQIIEEII